MNDSSGELESAEARVAASKAGIVAQVHALNVRVRRLVKSPYVIAALDTVHRLRGCLTRGR